LIGTMNIMEWTLQIVLVILLGATLLRAVRLERALGVLKRNRASLEALVVDFNASTHQAESGIQRLRAAADGTGRQIEAQLSKSLCLKDDLAFLTERGDRLADRLELLVRSARPLAEENNIQGQPGRARADKYSETAKDKGVSQVERDLLQALRMAR
jgi:Domain of unknown function (DUF6468)